LPLIFKFALEYAITRVQVNQNGLKFQMVHTSFWFMLMKLIYWEEVYILYRKNTEALVVTSKEISLEVNTDKTKYMVMSRDQNARLRHSIKTDNSSFERVEQFKYLGTTITNQNSIQENIKGRLKSGNASYHMVQNLLSSRLLPKTPRLRQTGL